MSLPKQDSTQRYVTHIPSIKLDSSLAKLSKLELTLIALCSVKPMSLHELESLTDEPYQRVSKVITKLANAGWLANTKYHVNGDTFSGINHPGTLQRTYPAIRSERINIPTTRKRLDGTWE